MMEKNAAMLIFMGKNYLGQKDNPVDESSLRAAHAILDGIETVIN